MQEKREGWTIEWFDDPQDADAQDREALQAMSPQERLNLLLGMMERWGRVRERRFERTIEVIELPRS